MAKLRIGSLSAAAAATTLIALAVPGSASPPGSTGSHDGVRFATFNASLNRGTPGELIQDLSTPDDQQAGNVAEIIQRTRPDVLLINEFDFDEAGEAASLFQDNYLSVPHNGAEPISYGYRYTAPSNTGVPTGFDLNHNGEVVTTVGQPGYGDDSQGFGLFPGQFGMVVYSKYPIDTEHARTFQNFLWKDMPGALLPTDPATGQPWYGDDVLEVLRLSSKSHWDLPIEIGHKTVHFLVSHPTPPTFDGAEDRNGTRNHDEIRFWSDYVTPRAGRYIYDDAGTRGGIKPGSAFVIAGDNNADPHDGDSVENAALQYLDNPRINSTFVPRSEGGVEASQVQGGANAGHAGDPANDTADFSDTPPFGPGNLRVDYVLPSKGLKVRGGGIFWPLSSDPLARLVWPAPGQPLPSSDHKLVWLDLKL